MSSSKNPKSSPFNAGHMVLDHLPSMPLLLSQAVFKSATFQPGDNLPKLRTDVRSLEIDAEHVQEYRKICGFSASPLLPPTYFAMFGFPLLLKIMVHDDFPLRVMGLVHLRNEISVFRSLNVTGNLQMSAELGASTITHAGLEWDINSEVCLDGEPVWACKSTFLHRYKTGLPRHRVRSTKPRNTPLYWRINAGTGRRYSRISGDYNPIHLSDITAKLFGFKQCIAHGMWTKARCVAAIEDNLPRCAYNLSVEFKRPLYLPSGVMFFQHRETDVRHFSLVNQLTGHAHLSGQIRELDHGD